MSATSTLSKLTVGDPVSGPGIPSDTTISQINGSQVTLSQNATGSGTESLAFTSIPVPQVIALIDPAGGVVTPSHTSTSGPLVPIDPPSGLKVWDYLASTTAQNGQAVQALGLSFYGTGLPAGGVLNFSLKVANVNDPPQLVSQTAGVTIQLENPEPLSVLVWSALTAAGLLRLRHVRRTSRVATGG